MLLNSKGLMTKRQLNPSRNKATKNGSHAHFVGRIAPANMYWNFPTPATPLFSISILHSHGATTMEELVHDSYTQATAYNPVEDRE